LDSKGYDETKGGHGHVGKLHLLVLADWEPLRDSPFKDLWEGQQVRNVYHRQDRYLVQISQVLDQIEDDLPPWSTINKFEE